MRKSLPKVIPGGPAWIANYWLLTGFLSVELLIGTCLLATLLLREPLDASIAYSDRLQNVTTFWCFVALTGIIVATLVWIV
jgi:heme/copper-type cytochrome/quinol oxidase subunit 3